MHLFIFIKMRSFFLLGPRFCLYKNNKEGSESTHCVI